MNGSLIRGGQEWDWLHELLRAVAEPDGTKEYTAVFAGFEGEFRANVIFLINDDYCGVLVYLRLLLGYDIQRFFFV